MNINEGRNSQENHSLVKHTLANLYKKCLESIPEITKVPQKSEKKVPKAPRNSVANENSKEILKEESLLSNLDSKLNSKLAKEKEVAAKAFVRKLNLNKVSLQKKHEKITQKKEESLLSELSTLENARKQLMDQYLSCKNDVIKNK